MKPARADIFRLLIHLGGEPGEEAMASSLKDSFSLRYRAARRTA